MVKRARIVQVIVLYLDIKLRLNRVDMDNSLMMADTPCGIA
jgi:hypothetical protein